MLRGALRRIAVLLGVIVGLTAAISAVLGALAHANLGIAISRGFYIVGVAVLVGSFAVGVRGGPIRPDLGDERQVGRPVVFGGVLPRAVKKTTPAERVAAVRNSVGLFLLGVVLLAIGAAVDPTKRIF